VLLPSAIGIIIIIRVYASAYRTNSDPLHFYRQRTRRYVVASIIQMQHCVISYSFTTYHQLGIFPSEWNLGVGD